MSITSTIKKMRDNEIMADLPKMSVNDLMAKRAELKQVLYNRQNNPDHNKQEIANISIAITRELTARAEAQNLKDGHDPKAETSKLIQSAQDQRKNSINASAQRKLDNARQTFDAMNGAQQFQWLEDNGRVNPHQQTIKHYGGSE